MYYISTRGGDERVTSAQAVKEGLAHNGGLFVPESVPKLSKEDLSRLSSLTYSGRAADILGMFLTDYDKDELAEDCAAAYREESFPCGAAPIKPLGGGMYVLELFRGPTCAFKDMALQLMPRLLSRALYLTKEKNDAYILVATSGDTGKAALEGYKDVPRVKIKVFYPVHGVSDIQKLQMQTQSGDNVSVCAIEGNFDDAQNGVKKIFSDKELNCRLNERGLLLTSANSINWGRLAPQVVYYVSAYLDLCAAGAVKMGDYIDVTVPTGNFGNIFAGFIAREMGLPIRTLVCASNKNNILTDFLKTGIYDRNRPFYQTSSPSMDILISSNLERLLYFICGAEKTAAYMKSLTETGRYEIERADFEKISAIFKGGYADETDTFTQIRRTYETKKYLPDTHTAVSLFCA